MALHWDRPSFRNHFLCRSYWVSHQLFIGVFFSPSCLFFHPRWLLMLLQIVFSFCDPIKNYLSHHNWKFWPQITFLSIQCFYRVQICFLHKYTQFFLAIYIISSLQLVNHYRNYHLSWFDINGDTEKALLWILWRSLWWDNYHWLEFLIFCCYDYIYLANQSNLWYR